MTLQEMRQQRKKLNDRNAELLNMISQDVEERPGKMTDEQVSDEFDSNETAIKELESKIQKEEVWEERRSATADRTRQISASVGTPSPPATAGQVTGEDRRDDAETQRGYHTEGNGQRDAWKTQVHSQYFGSLKNIHGERHGMTAEQRAYRIGQWGLMIAHMTLPNRYRFDTAVDFCEQQGLIVHGQGSSDTTGAHITVPDEFSADLIDLKESRGVVRRLFGREPMLRDTKIVPRRVSGLTAYAVGENATGTESNMQLDDVHLTARKWMVLTRMSKELDQNNAVGFGDRLAGEISYAFADKEDEAGFNGDGTSTYHGIIGARARLQDVDGSGTDSNGLVTGTGNAYSELTLADFESVVGTLPQFADTPETVWVAHRLFYFTVMKRLELASGGATAMEISDGAGARRPRPLFLGYPVEFSQVMPSTEANSQVCALFGDFNVGATFGDRRGEEIEFDDTVVIGGQSVWERDQIGIKGTERYDINVHEFGSSTAAGAIVGLQTAAS